MAGLVRDDRVAFRELAARCDQVFAFGLSMGGTLVTRLAEDHPDEVAGLVLVNPAYATRRFDARFAKFVAPIVAVTARDRQRHQVRRRSRAATTAPR